MSTVSVTPWRIRGLTATSVCPTTEEYKALSYTPPEPTSGWEIQTNQGFDSCKARRHRGPKGLLTFDVKHIHSLASGDEMCKVV
ncbi:hypothetical protein ColKHC_04890 [Colletotrichum higginsianum]|nr:hypothetical protein ColKHC_04890 [Colletotrichum higginsianum]